MILATFRNAAYQYSSYPPTNRCFVGKYTIIKTLDSSDYGSVPFCVVPSNLRVAVKPVAGSDRGCYFLFH